jgi:hypothetical protein
MAIDVQLEGLRRGQLISRLVFLGIDPNATSQKASESIRWPDLLGHGHTPVTRSRVGR